MSQQINIIVYSKNNCMYCEKAKALIKGLGFKYEEKMYGVDFKTPKELFKQLGKQVRTMPQIKIDDKVIGGYNQLVEHFTDLGLVNYKGEKVARNG